MSTLCRTAVLSQTPIHVIMRMCPDSKLPGSGNTTRPSWFNKQKVFETVFRTRDDRTDFTVIFDGDVTGHWISQYPTVRVLPVHVGTDPGSFNIVLQLIEGCTIPDTDIVYILEDDYVHKSGWPTLLREGLLGPHRPSNATFDYITLYDHLDKYEFSNDALRALYSNLQSRIVLSDSTHWRTVPSTTNTFASMMKTLREDLPFYFQYLTRDNERFRFLEKKGRVLASCLPAASTHAHTDYIAPFTDWGSLLLLKQYRYQNEIASYVASHRNDISDHLETIYTAVMELTPPPKQIVELGVCGGESTYVFNCINKEFGSKITSVDIIDVNQHHGGYRCDTNGTFVCSDDIPYAEQYRQTHGADIDVLFIDTSHEYEHTVQEIKHWFPLLKQKALVLFHDTNLRGPTVLRKNGEQDVGRDINRAVIRAIEEYFGQTFNETEPFETAFSHGSDTWRVKHFSYCYGLTLFYKN